VFSFGSTLRASLSKGVLVPQLSVHFCDGFVQIAEGSEIKLSLPNWHFSPACLKALSEGEWDIADQYQAFLRGFLAGCEMPSNPKPEAAS
jgi:hypothetical protein